MLFAPLDWGLGHTTRCLPIIKAFQAAGADVVIACNNNQETLLQAELEGVRFLPLKGYGLRYSTSKWFTWVILAYQIPKILTSIKTERRWLDSLQQKEMFDVLVSDNRYGLHHESCYSIFITHQLRIRVPFSRMMENLLQFWNYRFIRRFDECWVPDFEGQKNLAGELSHPKQLPAINLRYVGAVSRFKKRDNSVTESKDLVALISGPEPQRTIFEDKLVSELANWKGSAVVVRGLPGATACPPAFNNVSFQNHLPSSQLSELIDGGTYIVARSGYSTVMDIVALKKKSILIPTPGQTEQEYLGNWLMKNKICLCIDQENFHLSEAINAASKFDYADLSRFTTDQYESEVSNFMHQHFKETIQSDV